MFFVIDSINYLVGDDLHLSKKIHQSNTQQYNVRSSRGGNANNHNHDNSEISKDVKYMVKRKLF